MRQVFIPSLLGRDAVSDLERDWLNGSLSQFDMGAWTL